MMSMFKDQGNSLDRDLIRLLNDNIPLQAGLFSAVLTGFLLDVRRELEQDPQATTNALLTELVEVPRSAQLNGVVNLPIPRPSPHMGQRSLVLQIDVQFDGHSRSEPMQPKVWVAQWQYVSVTTCTMAMPRKPNHFLSIEDSNLDCRVPVPPTYPLPVAVETDGVEAG